MLDPSGEGPFFRPPARSYSSSYGNSQDKIDGNDALGIVFSIAFMIAAFAVYSIGSWLLPILWRYTTELAPRVAVQAIGPVAVLVAGSLFFAFKRRKRWWYGWCEVCIGSVAGWDTFRRLTSPASAQNPKSVAATLAIAGAIYIVVRGMENMSEAHRQLRAHTARTKPVTTTAQ